MLFFWLWTGIEFWCSIKGELVNLKAIRARTTAVDKITDLPLILLQWQLGMLNKLTYFWCKYASFWCYDISKEKLACGFYCTIHADMASELAETLSQLPKRLGDCELWFYTIRHHSVHQIFPIIRQNSIWIGGPFLITTLFIWYFGNLQSNKELNI